MANFSAEAAPVEDVAATKLRDRRLKIQRSQANSQWKTMGARQIFSILLPHLLESRPVVGQKRGPYKLDKTGRKRYLNKPEPIFGAPTFRNVINEQGEHV